MYQYAHFLQPNQYVSFTKKFTPEELRVAYIDNHPYKLPVERGYPFLRQYENLLVKKGVKSYDLTLVFKDITDSIYTDACCHVNEKGNCLIATTIGEIILQDLISKASRPNEADLK